MWYYRAVAAKYIYENFSKYGGKSLYGMYDDFDTFLFDIHAGHSYYWG